MDEFQNFYLIFDIIPFSSPKIFNSAKKMKMSVMKTKYKYCYCKHDLKITKMLSLNQTF